MTNARDDNDNEQILRFYWDDETEPSVEVPLGDFFCNAWGHKKQKSINSSTIVVNPLNGYNSFWQMPFRKKFKIMMENTSQKRTRLFYSVNYTLTKIPKFVGCFSQYRWHIMDPVRFKSDFKVTIQCLGWDDEGNYLPLQDKLTSVAYWYQVR